ncbi:MAG: ABC transporter ATP-binding protein/permease [bacterium]|nr:ABC transporter ATP-binding protein/permease [bacterium]
MEESRELTEKFSSEDEAFSWPISRLGEALEMLAQKSSLKPRSIKIPPPPQSILLSLSAESISEALGAWIDSAARCLGLEAEPIEITYAMSGKILPRVAPALILLPGQPQSPARQQQQPAPEQPEAAWRFLVLIPARRQGRRSRSLSVLRSDHKVQRIDLEIVRSLLCWKLEAYLAPEIDRLFDQVKAVVNKSHRGRMRAKILAEHLAPFKVSCGWLLRLSPGASFWEQMKQARLCGYFFALTGTSAAQYALMIFSWWLIGRGALQGRLDLGWLIAWALLLLSMIPLQMLTTWFQGCLAINAAGLLKQRLLYGALQLEPEEISHQGTGQLLGRVIESEALESLALSGGLSSLSLMIELVAASAILVVGAAGRLSSLLFLAWMGIGLLLGWRYFAARWQWTKARLEITHDLVERMVGHRTRLAQERRQSWHEGEDHSAEHYLELSKTMDRRSVLLTTLVPSGWLVLGLIGLSVAFVSGQAQTASAMAVGLAGILLAQRGLGKLPSGLLSLADAAIAWKQVAPLFHAAGRDSLATDSLPSSCALAYTAAGPYFHQDGQPADERYPLIEAQNLTFRYRGHSQPAIFGCSLQIWPGDQLLLEGPSGGGKSTLVSLLIGLRVPESGLLLMSGLDLSTIGGKEWRRRVVAAPQFHENHVLSAPLAFNLLMGRRWPPQPADLEEAEKVCRKLGLGDLLDRMPAGLMQPVGETGWQLSHGEKSRLYIARALLQAADLIILDESFAALDPESLNQALSYVLEQAPTLLVIAHP